ncbi:MAG: hypothetical protein ACKO2K_02970 [Alphaproteobacteria bacterium]
MSDGAKILRGPWRGAPAPSCEEAPPAPGRAPAARGPADEGSPDGARPAPAAREEETIGPGRVHLGFVVRDCTVALGHRPTPEELAWWANHQCDERGEFRLFGRDITAAEAKVILSHPGRTVSVRPDRARPHVAPAGSEARGDHGSD